MRLPGISILRSTIYFSALSFMLSTPVNSADFSEILNKIRLKPGFKIAVYAEMPKPRQMEINPANGVVYVGSRHGHIYSLLDSNNDGTADKISERARGLNGPNGVVIIGSDLYVGLQDRIARWPLPKVDDFSLPINPLTTINSNLLNNNWHGWRSLGVGPDKKLYVALGAPCNICTLKPNTGKIVRMNLDGSGWEVVADGVRNSVGFDWHPKTKELWFTDNGADGMGDDIPADELNRVTKVGQHFGFPYLGGKSARLPGFENNSPAIEMTPPKIEFQAHTANLGIEFYEGDMFPAEYKNDAFVAQRGSWDRSEPVGYRIMRILFDDDGNAIGKEVFADGWLSNGAAIGRPVDIEELPDGSILISDDFASVIYRISYEE